MTANELVAVALAHMAEPATSKSDYNDYCIPVINVLLAECFELNNGIRKSSELEPFNNIPFIKSMEDAIDYDIGLMHTCISYGLAAKLILEDNDIGKFNYYNGMYTGAMRKNMQVSIEPIKDYYGEE